MPDQPEPAQRRTKKESRAFWWVLVVVSLVMIGVSGFSLAKRIDQYNKTNDNPLFAFIQATSPSFTFAGRPVTVVEETRDDKAVIVVTYGDEELVLDVAVPPVQPLPDLYDRQKDWLTISLFADRSGMSMKEFEAKIISDEIKPRLGIITRTPFGIEPAKAPRFEGIEHEKNASTADVHREQWRFDCYEFLRDGTITHEIKRYPESGKSLARRQNYAKLKGEPIPGRRDDELAEYTWQYGAALKVMPRAPAITHERQALRVSGWTLPATATGFLLLLVSFFFAIAPKRTAAP